MNPDSCYSFAFHKGIVLLMLFVENELEDWNTVCVVFSKFMFYL